MVIACRFLTVSGAADAKLPANRTTRYAPTPSAAPVRSLSPPRSQGRPPSDHRGHGEQHEQHGAVDVPAAAGACAELDRRVRRPRDRSRSPARPDGGVDRERPGRRTSARRARTGRPRAAPMRRRSAGRGAGACGGALGACRRRDPRLAGLGVARAPPPVVIAARWSAPGAGRSASPRRTAATASANGPPVRYRMPGSLTSVISMSSRTLRRQIGGQRRRLVSLMCFIATVSAPSPVNGRLPETALVANDSQRVDVAGGGRVVAQRLLGGDVLGGAHHHAGLGDRQRRRRPWRCRSR